MRIEPTTKPLPRQQSNRRHLANLETRARQAGSAAREMPGTALTTTEVFTPARAKTRGTGRWRSDVPFLAQYIGQKIATETPARAARRAPEKALKAYKNRENPQTFSRTMACV